MNERQRLFEVLQELTAEELQIFFFLLPDTIPRGKRTYVSLVDLAEVLLRYFPKDALVVAAHALQKMQMNHLASQLRGELGGVRSLHETREGEMEITPQGAAAAVPPRLVTQKQLMTLASKMGRNWKQIGILSLGLENSRLEQIEEENPRNVTMQIFHMLCDWRNREKNKATAAQLYSILNQTQVELDPDAYMFLIE